MLELHLQFRWRIGTTPVTITSPTGDIEPRNEKNRINATELLQSLPSPGGEYFTRSLLVASFFGSSGSCVSFPGSTFFPRSCSSSGLQTPYWKKSYE